MLKKITSLITIAAFTLSLTVTFAADKTDVKYFMQESFDSFKSSWTTKGEAVSLSVVPGNVNGDKSLKLEAYKNEKTSVNIPIEEIGSSFTVDFNFRSELLKNDVNTSFSNASGETVDVFTALSGGSFALKNPQGETAEVGEYNGGAME